MKMWLSALHLRHQLIFGTAKKHCTKSIAARYNLPTDESHSWMLNDIYKKIGAAEFARVGHYLQMLDNKATAIRIL